MDEIELHVQARFRERAEQYRSDLEEAWNDALPGNHTPAEAIFLAELMTSSDGYNDVRLVREWRHLPKSGWQTSLVYLVDVGRHLVPFAFECRYESFARQLAIQIDDDRPGERTPEKLQRENAILALGFRVLTFTERDILADAAGCRERVEEILADMSDAVLVDAGMIGQR